MFSACTDGKKSWIHLWLRDLGAKKKTKCWQKMLKNMVQKTGVILL